MIRFLIGIIVGIFLMVGPTTLKVLTTPKKPLLKLPPVDPNLIQYKTWI